MVVSTTSAAKSGYTTYQVGIRFRLHVYPTLGHLPLRTITPSVIRQWTSGLRMARSYQRTIFANVSQVAMFGSTHSVGACSHFGKFFSV